MRRMTLVSFFAVLLGAFGAVPAGAAVPQSGVVSNSAVSWTPNISAGTTNSSVCVQYFGSGGCRNSDVYSTTVVNGEVVVAGAFTQVCQPGPSSTGYCKAGTSVTRDDIFAYQLGTGVIDPSFAPQVSNGPVKSVAAGPDGTVYVGGDFTSIDGVSERGVAEVNVTPGNASTDGTLVSGFTGHVSGNVQSLAVSGSALYIGGQFSVVDSTTKEDGIARLNAATGAVDHAFGLSISQPLQTNKSEALQVEALSVSADGSQLAIAGPFLAVGGQSRPRVAIIATGGGLGQQASVENWAAPILQDNCGAEHDDVRAIDFSPDGSFLVIADTGYTSATSSNYSVCDAAARFPTAPTGTDISPSWINYAGGDSFYSVQVTGNVVYLGGHNRWVNNECGNNYICAPDAVLVMGVAAVDANTGLAIPWFHPLTERGRGTESLTAIPAGDFAGSDGGLLVGNNINYNAGAYHAFNMYLPLTSSASSSAFGSIPSGLFSEGNIGGYDEGNGGYGTQAMCVDDAGDAATAGSPVEFETCTNAAEQNWTVQPDGNIEVNGLCLDTAGQAAASGTAVDVNTCGSSATQVWTQGSGNTLVNQASGLCLTDPGASTSNGTALDVETCDGATDQVWPLPVAPAPASLTPTGAISSPQEQGNGQPACITGNSKASGSAVVMYNCFGNPGMQATIAANGNIQINGLCLDTAGGATAAGTQVVLNTCNSSATQVWTQASGYQLQNSGAGGLCLNMPSAQNGSTLTIASCDGQGDQQWRLPAV